MFTFDAEEDAKLVGRVADAICGAGAEFMSEPLSEQAYRKMATAALMELFAEKIYVVPEEFEKIREMLAAPDDPSDSLINLLTTSSGA